MEKSKVKASNTQEKITTTAKEKATVTRKEKPSVVIKESAAVPEKTKPEVIVKEIAIKPAKSKASTEKVGQGYGTGRRKNAIARVWVYSGTGNITVNKKSVDSYFSREAHRKSILAPFASTKSTGQYDVKCTVKGGGSSGQAGAIIHGVARALVALIPDFRPTLSREGFLTRDPRVVERKKYGKHKARKSTQFSKR